MSSSRGLGTTVGREDAGAYARKSSREADWRSHWYEPRRARARALQHNLGRADSPPLHARRSPHRLELRSISWLSRPTALHARHSLDRLPPPALDDAHVLRFCLAGRDESTLQISARTRRRRPFCSLRSPHVDGL